MSVCRVNKNLLCCSQTVFLNVWCMAYRQNQVPSFKHILGLIVLKFLPELKPVSVCRVNKDLLRMFRIRNTGKIGSPKVSIF